MASFIQSGINFLDFRRVILYPPLRPTAHNFFSERAIGSEQPFQKSSKPVFASPGAGFFKHHFLWGTFLESISA